MSKLTLSSLLPPNPSPTLEWLEQAERVWRSHVVYEYDHLNPETGNKHEHFRSLLPRIIRRLNGDEEGSLPVPDDCDSWSFTAIDVAIFGGVNRKDCRLLMVNSPMGQRLGKPYDHMIGAIRVDKSWYVVGDTFAPGPYPVSLCNHKLYAYHTIPILDDNFHLVDSWEDV